MFLLCLKHSAGEISFKDISLHVCFFFFFGVLPALDGNCSASGRAAGSGAGHCLCSVSSLNRAGVIPALP